MLNRSSARSADTACAGDSSCPSSRAEMTGERAGQSGSTLRGVGRPRADGGRLGRGRVRAVGGSGRAHDFFRAAVIGSAGRGHMVLDRAPTPASRPQGRLRRGTAPNLHMRDCATWRREAAMPNAARRDSERGTAGCMSPATPGRPARRYRNVLRRSSFGSTICGRQQQQHARSLAKSLATKHRGGGAEVVCRAAASPTTATLNTGDSSRAGVEAGARAVF